VVTLDTQSTGARLAAAIARILVDRPDDVAVQELAGQHATIIQLRVHPSDLGRVIGKRGRLVQSIRTILYGVGMKEKRRYLLEILKVPAQATGTSS
jgi:predicted RNA-binding protein YlqC (UPF0109 family)